MCGVQDWGSKTDYCFSAAKKEAHPALVSPRRICLECEKERLDIASVKS